MMVATLVEVVRHLLLLCTTMMNNTEMKNKRNRFRWFGNMPKSIEEYIYISLFNNLGLQHNILIRKLCSYFEKPRTTFASLTLQQLANHTSISVFQYFSMLKRI